MSNTNANAGTFDIFEKPNLPRAPNGQGEGEVNPSWFEQDDEAKVPLRPLGRPIHAKETVSSYSFFTQHHIWLNQLLSGNPNRDEIIPLILRYVTKDTMRLLLPPYHEAVFRVFREMGDSTRMNWALEPHEEFITLVEDVPVPQPSNNNKRYLENAERLWELGDSLLRQDNLEGTELMRMSTDFLVSHEYFKRRELYIRDKVTMVNIAASQITKLAKTHNINFDELRKAIQQEMKEQSQRQRTGVNPGPASQPREDLERPQRGVDDTQSDGRL
ncbi:hypothetical protein BGZ63DRAFT_381970 [Mariannaea sp. PMI_226]|nr:hypothetical protein BGZ63DRAFT_381970 [Mariannaea sp. PMI_226]